MAKGRKIREARIGIAISTVLALAVSGLILIVGLEAKGEVGENFQTSDLTKVIDKHLGIKGVYVFSVAFMVASLSSMFTVPLGAAKTAESIFAKLSNEQEAVEVKHEQGEVGGNRNEPCE